MVRATPLTALGEGDVRGTDPKLLDSARRRREQGEKKNRAGDGREVTTRVRRSVSRELSAQLTSVWGLKGKKRTALDREGLQQLSDMSGTEPLSGSEIRLFPPVGVT